MNSTAEWLALKGKVCVVTGAASGIGAEAARRLAAAGALVALMDRDGQGAVRVAAEIESVGGRAVGLAADVTQQESVFAAAEQLQAGFGPCNVLVNNAAAIYPNALMDVERSRWDQLMAVNVSGSLLCAQIFGRQMIATGAGGSMIHVGSISGSIPQPYGGAYSVSKAALKMLSRLLTVELAEHRIRSNVVSPAMVATPMSESIYKNAEVRRLREELVPAGRISGPADLADAILFLASERSSYINGQELLLDGGLSQTWLGLIPRPGLDKAAATS